MSNHSDSPPHSEPNTQNPTSPPPDSPKTLTLQNTQHSNHLTRTPNHQDEDNPRALDPDNQDPDHQFGNPILSPPSLTSSQTLTLESTQQSNLPARIHNLKDDDGLNAFGEDNRDPDRQFGNTTLTSPVYVRRVGKRKKGGLNKKKQQAIEKKVQTLMKTLNPIPFVPAKTLDFERHEKVLKRLELWEFAHIEFDRSIRTDLIAQLVVNYDSKSRSSYVNGYRISLNRPALGRALKIPVKKEKSGSGAQETVVVDVGEYDGLDPGFVEEFLSTWVLLHGDTWMMPSEVMSWTTEIKSGRPEKADWAGLVWFMVEKELSQGVKLEDCYYASHLQYLIKSQREEVFWEEEPEVDVREEEGAVPDKAVDGGGVVVGEEEVVGLDKVVEVDDGSFIVEEPNVELTLRLEIGEKEEVRDGETMNADESKEGETMVMEESTHDVVRGDCILDGKNLTGVQFLQHCSVEKDKSLDVDEESKLEEGERTCIGEEEGERTRIGEEEVERTYVGEEEDEMKLEEDGEGHEVKLEEDGEGDEMKLEEDGERDEMKIEEDGEGDEMNFVEDGERDDEEEGERDDDEEDDGEFGLTPNIHGLGNTGFGSNVHQGISMNHTSYGVSGPFDEQSNMGILSSRAEPYSSSGGLNHNDLKREISYDHDFLHDPLSVGTKRLRTDGSSSKSSDFVLCLDQIQLWVGKARVAYEAKEKEVEDLSHTQQILIGEVQRRDNVIEHLQKVKYDELQKKDEEIYRLDRELFVMGNLINGYRDAIKATCKDFSEYRKRNQLPEEPIYKDVGPGGLMLSTLEIERQRLKREEEDRINRAIIEQNMKQYEEECVDKFQGYFNQVQMMDMKLLDLEKQVSQIKEVTPKGRVSEMVDSAAPIE